MEILELKNIIKERREVLKITQEGLSEISGVNLRTIKQIETGSGNPRLSTLNSLMECLGMGVYITLNKIDANQ